MNFLESRRRRDEELRSPGDAGQHKGEQGGEAKGEPFSLAPCNALGEESISPSDQVTWADHERGIRVTPEKEKLPPNRTRRDGTPWAKHHHCRIGWPDAKRETPLPTAPCNSIQSNLQIKLALGRQLKIINKLTWNSSGRGTELHIKGNLSHTRDEAVDEEVEKQRREDSALSFARVQPRS